MRFFKYILLSNLEILWDNLIHLSKRSAKTLALQHDHQTTKGLSDTIRIPWDTHSQGRVGKILGKFRMVLWEMLVRKNWVFCKPTLKKKTRDTHNYPLEFMIIDWNRLEIIGIVGVPEWYLNSKAIAESLAKAPHSRPSVQPAPGCRVGFEER